MEDAVFHWVGMVIACAVAITGYVHCLLQVLFAHEAPGLGRVWALVPPLPIYMRWQQKGRWSPLLSVASFCVYLGLWLTQ